MRITHVCASADEALSPPHQDFIGDHGRHDMATIVRPSERTSSQGNTIREGMGQGEGDKYLLREEKCVQRCNPLRNSKVSPKFLNVTSYPHLFLAWVTPWKRGTSSLPIRLDSLERLLRMSSSVSPRLREGGGMGERLRVWGRTTKAPSTYGR